MTELLDRRKSDRLWKLETEVALLKAENDTQRRRIENLSGGISRGLWLLGGGFIAAFVSWVVAGGFSGVR
jgi:hypothetical protein